MTAFVKFNLLVVAILSLVVALLGYSGGYSSAGKHKRLSRI